MIDSTLSHYQIVAELGRGGMGIVYKAEDTKLDRIVAIKVLPSAALANADDRARFYREAKAAAQLHHPHIASIFEIDEAVPSDAPHGTEPSPFIAMEFVDGGTLRAEIDRGPMKLTEAARITSQVAEALKLAHSKEIVHRDIKSHNVMLTKDGDAKVLDFGLAKTAQSTMLTRMGSTLGTVAYMSPEQARGDDVDHRTDIWSLGVMLFEMVAGRLPFAGEYEKAVMYGILNEMAPPLTSLRTGVPMGLEWIVSKCLAKSPDERYQNAADLIVDLKTVDLSASGLSRTSASASTLSGVSTAQIGAPTLAASQTSKATIPLIPAIVGAIILLVAGTFLGRSFFQSAEDDLRPIRKYSMDLPGLMESGFPNISPDGRWMYVEATDTLGWSGGFRIQLQSGAVERISGTEGGQDFQVSPDGERLMFFETGGMIKVIPTLGGSAVAVVRAQTASANWHPDGSILYPSNNQIWRVNASGDDPVQVSFPDSTAGEIGHYNPSSLPDGRHALMHIVTTGGVRSVSVLDLSEGTHKILGPGSSPQYVPTGHVMYFDGEAAFRGQLLARPFDLNTLEFAGTTTSLAANVGGWTFTFDQQGTFFSNFFDTENVSNTRQTQFFALAPGDDSFQQTTLSGVYNNFRVSPDGSKIAVSVDYAGVPDYIIVLDRESEVQSQINFEGDADFVTWTADGSKLYVEVDSHLEVYSATGSGRLATYVTREDLASFDVSPDGSTVVYTDNPAQGPGQLRMFSVEDSSDVIFFDGVASSPRISPNGKYVAFHNEEYEVFVKEIDGDGLYLASRDVPAGRNPVWGPRGDFLYFDAISNRLVRVAISLEKGFTQLSRIQELTQFSGAFLIDLTMDGEIIAVSSGFPDAVASDAQPQEFEADRYDVTVNWFEELKQLAPRDDR